jgi:aspartate/methionine/tyrosine aminotransferase
MADIAPFKLERYFAQYEFNSRYLLSCSDCESLSMQEVVDMADPQSRQMWETLQLGYTESLGHPVLRSEIASQYGKITPGEVLVITPEEGIFIAMQTLLRPGDHVISISPAYQSLYEIARSMGCDVSTWQVNLMGDQWQIDLEDLEAKITPKTRLLVINFPHNPTGYLATRQEQEQIIALAHKYDLYLFSDEMYRGLEYNPEKRLPALCDLYEKGISLSGMSKTYALPGLRLGWLATRDRDAFRRWITYKDYTTICHSAPSEILGLIALRNGQAIIHRNLEIIGSSLKTADEFCTEFSEYIQWIPPQAGSIAFPRMNVNFPVADFCLDVLQKENVMIAPADMFDYPGNHIRLGLGRKNFSEAMGKLGDYLVNSKNFGK